MAQSVDESVGRLLSKLDQLGLSDRTAVIFMSDNGGLWPQATSNAPLRAGKGFPYEGGIREPLIIRYPGPGPAGAICDVPVISNDFFPTVLELAGRDGAATFAGAHARQREYKSPLILGQNGRFEALAAFGYDWAAARFER